MQVFYSGMILKNAILQFSLANHERQVIVQKKLNTDYGNYDTVIKY